jgi:superfamily II DNA/RNA helicase
MQTGLKVNTCYGGHPIATEINNFSVPPDLLIGTPGRIADHIRRQSFDPSGISSLVLDEFDKSLELGFKDEMEFIIKSCNSIKTRILTSATSLQDVPDFVGIKNPVNINYQKPTGEAQLSVKVIRAEGTDKLELLYKLICKLGSESSVIFCNHREAVERISSLLSEYDIAHGIYHGGQEQEDRELSVIKFRNGTHHLLLSTDLASRGLDIPEIKNIIHYQLPTSITSWTHRNGRTARMHGNGTAWVLLAGDDYLPVFIEDKVDDVIITGDFEKPEETLFETIYFSAGRKDKISKGDIAGFLIQKGMLTKEDIGRIEVLDYASFAAVKRDALPQMLRLVKGEQIKKKKVKIDIAR